MQKRVIKLSKILKIAAFFRVMNQNKKTQPYKFLIQSLAIFYN